MLFRIEGDSKEIKPYLEEFVKAVENEWKPQIEMAREKLKKLPLPIKVDIPLPDEITIPVWEENNVVFLRVPVALPFGRVWQKPKKKMHKNLEGLLKSKGIKAKVTYEGD